MRISGHRTRAVFDRYNICSEGDLIQASERIEAHRKASVAVKKVHKKEHIGVLASA